MFKSITNIKTRTMKQLFYSLLLFVAFSGISLFSYAQQDCTTPNVVLSLPYSQTGLTTVGTVDDYDPADACGSAAMENEDYVFSFTPSEDMNITVSLLNTTVTPFNYANIGLFITDACPDDVAATCVASNDASQSNPSISGINLIGGTTYYIIVSSANIPLLGATNVNFDIEITKDIADDLSVTAIEGIVSSCSLTTATVGCYITNNGYHSASGFDVTYRINGVDDVVENFVGSIDPLTTAYFEFAQTAHFTTDGEYTIEVFTNLTGDENPLNDLLAQTVVRYPVYNSFPYNQDFESSNGFWSISGTTPSWEYGNPDETISGLIINSAASGDNCWVTNLEGAATTNENSYITSPCFDLSTLLFPTVAVNVWADFGFFGNSAILQGTIDGGATWVDINTWTASTTGWTGIEVMVPSFAGAPEAMFRFNYVGGFLVGNGLAIDDFQIKEAILNDLGVVAITAPVSGCGLSADQAITIQFTNYGAQVQSNIRVDFSSDGGLTWLDIPETVIMTLQPGESGTYTFLQHIDMTTTGEYQIIAKTSNPGDEDPTNDEMEITVVSQNTIAAADYQESFETGAAGWFAYGTNSTMELAMPANTLINVAAEGDYAWVTNADGFNDPAEISYLESPCFDFTEMVNPMLKAMIQYETSEISNFYVEYSIDGYTWDTLNAGTAPTNWYGTGGILSFGTWSGSSAGWIMAITDMPQLVDQTSVKFRFVFNNGFFSMTDTEGVAVDQFVIYDCTNIPAASFSFAVDGSTVTFTNESENATSYLWNYGDNQLMPTTSTEESPSFTYLMDGSYLVTLTATNECSSSVYTMNIDIITNIELLEAAGLSVYPNPVSENLNIVSSDAKIISIELVSLSGQILVSEITNSNSVNIDVNEYAKGIYTVKVTTTENASAFSIVIE